MARPFRLHTVARLREARRDAARTHLADALRAAEVLQERQEELSARLQELTEQRRRASGKADTAWLLNAGRYELVLRADQRELDKNTTNLEQEIERRRAALAEADREVRALEILQERADQQQRAEEAHREARLLDEFSARRHASARRTRFLQSDNSREEVS